MTQPAARSASSTAPTGCVWLGRRSSTWPFGSPLISGEPNGHVELRLPSQTHPVGAVLEALRAAGCVIEDVHTREPDLEDIFVELTGA